MGYRKLSNKERHKKQVEIVKRWREKNREKLREYYKKWREKRKKEGDRRYQ